MLSPAQFVIVLWLLTAAAPAATALLHGAMLPMGPVSAQSRECPRPSRDPVAEQEIVAEPARAESPGHVASAELCFAPEGVVAGLDASVLHTGVQRHRPKSA
ncbi:MAG: hypothetical protein ABMA13_08360 [Chthoniobacteraceae bacterium]